MKRYLALAFLICSTSWSAALAAPETGAVSAPALAEHVAGIRQALDELVVLLESVQHNQRVELLLKRIELRERRLAPLEKRLAGAQTEVESLEGELLHMRAMHEQQEQELDEALRSGTEEDDGVRRMLKEIETMQLSTEARVEEARMRARRFEDELADGRDEIEILDELLLEALGAD